jgi:hypothetical protein
MGRSEVIHRGEWGLTAGDTPGLARATGPASALSSWPASAAINPNRVLIPVLSNTERRWVLTVLGEISSSRAIALLLSPRPTSRTTCSSRSLRFHRPGTDPLGGGRRRVSVMTTLVTLYHRG